MRKPMASRVQDERTVALWSELWTFWSMLRFLARPEEAATSCLWQLHPLQARRRSCSCFAWKASPPELSPQKRRQQAHMNRSILQAKVVVIPLSWTFEPECRILMLMGSVGAQKRWYLEGWESRGSTNHGACQSRCQWSMSCQARDLKCCAH